MTTTGKKKVLIVTYYWPPSGGSGVQRWLYFTKYLKDFNWEPIIYTMKDADYPIIDNNLAKLIPSDITILKEKGFEPFTIYKFITGQKNKQIPNSVVSKKNMGILHDISVWIRGNFFIPDARKFWVNPSVKFLSKYIENNEIDVIVSTSPPQSTHLIALKLHEKFNIPWLADFRDPWTKVSYFNNLKLTSSSKKKHIFLEKKVLKTATEVCTVTWQWQRDFEEIRGKSVNLITNGFDNEIKTSTTSKNEKFTIGYFGVLWEDRNPTNFWKAIETLYQKDQKFRNNLEIIFVGNIDESIINNLKKYEFFQNVRFTGLLSHKDIFKYYELCDILLLIGIPREKGVLPGKLFEYLSLKKPILSIGELFSDTQRLIDKTQSGLHSEFSNYESTSKNVELLWKLYLDDSFKDIFNFENESIEAFTRKNLTKKLSELLNKMTNSK